MTKSDDVRYASAEAVLLALDKDLDTVNERLEQRAEQRAKAATETWINRTGRPFHPVRVGDPGEARSWETHDAHDICSARPATIHLDEKPVLPLEPEEGDAIEVRTRRDSWRDITEMEGQKWTLDYQSGRLSLYRRRLSLTPFDDPRQRVVRLTYRYGPLGEEVEISEDGLVESVPPNVTQAVAAKAAMRLALDDDAMRGGPDSGQLTDRGSKRSAFQETWESTTTEYASFSTL